MTVEDMRIYERALSDAGAEDYNTDEWEAEHKYFVSARWEKKFNGLFLDYGCGTGLVSKNLGGIEKVVGVDISRNMCFLTKKECGVPVVVADGLHLPFKDRVFSVVCVSGVLHHLRQQLEEAFVELGRCSNKAICIIEPSTTPPPLPLRILRFFNKVYEWLMFQMIYKNKNDKYTFSIHEGPLNYQKLEKLCVKNGFRVSETRFFNHIPKLHKLMNKRLLKHMINSLISSSRGTDVEIIAVRNS